MVEKQNELDNCNFAKTVLMLLVVLYHSMVFWTENWFCDIPIFHSTALSFFAKWLDSFHIYAFTLISGYIFYYLQCECKKHYRTYGMLVKSKFKRLIVPYIFVSIAWVIPISAYFFHDSVKEVVYKYALATAPSQLWFLFMLFDVFLLFYLLESVSNKVPAGLPPRCGAGVFDWNPWREVFTKYISNMDVPSVSGFFCNWLQNKTVRE